MYAHYTSTDRGVVDVVDVVRAVYVGDADDGGTPGGGGDRPGVVVTH